MAELTQLDEKIGEVLGLAQAAQSSTAKVRKLVEDTKARETLEQMNQDAKEVRQRCEGALDDLDGAKTAIRRRARESKAQAEETMRTYLSDPVDALAGFEFLIMAEAGELGHWEIVGAINERVGNKKVRELTDFAIPIEERHFDEARHWSVELARGSQ
jgi:hypothetical protein